MTLVLILSALMALFVFSSIGSFFIMIPVTYIEIKHKRDRYELLYRHLKEKTNHELFVMSVTEVVKYYREAIKSFGAGIYKFFVYVVPFIAVGIGAAAGAAWLVFHISKLIFATLLGQLPF